MSPNGAFVPGRGRRDTTDAFPAIGLLLGAVLGFFVGLVQGVGGPVALGGAGMALGFVIGLIARTVARSRR